MGTASAPERPTGIAPRPGPASVLLVDDDPTYLGMVALQLERDGHTVVTASDGVEAVAIAQRESPDIVFLDIALPGIDGLEVITRLKADPATSAIPVVVVSGRCERQLIAECRRLGAIDFLNKSSSVPATLSLAVRSFATSRSGAA